MSKSSQCIAYLNAKKHYVERLNTVIATQPSLWDDIMKNNFDQVDKPISKSLIRELSESSKNLEQFFFSDMINDSGRRDIVNAIFLHPNRDTYVRTSDFEFLLIRKYDLPFIHDFLKMELIDRLGDSGFEGLRNSELFNEILKIEKDKDVFVLHSGVKQVFGIFSKDRAQQHCPLILSLVRLMTRHHIPFDSSRPEVQKCTRAQHESEFDFSTVPVPTDDGDDAVRVSKINEEELAGGRTKKCKISNRMQKRVTRTRRTRRTRKSLRKH